MRVIVNFLNLRLPHFTAAKVQISETQYAQLVNPSAYARFVTEDLPRQLTFLSLFAVGQSYAIEQAYDDSIRVIEKAIAALAPEAEPEGLAEAHFRLGWLYQRPMDNDEQAILNYDRAIELDPDDANAYGRRGLAQRELENAETALSDFYRYLELRPDDPYRQMFEEWIAELEAQISEP